MIGYNARYKIKNIYYYEKVVGIFKDFIIVSGSEIKIVSKDCIIKEQDEIDFVIEEHDNLAVVLNPAKIIKLNKLAIVERLFPKKKYEISKKQIYPQNDLGGKASLLIYE